MKRFVIELVDNIYINNFVEFIESLNDVEIVYSDISSAVFIVLANEISILEIKKNDFIKSSFQEQ